MVKYNASLIAHWFIRRNNIEMETEGGDNLTLLKLLKLLYYAEGCSLAVFGKSLFPEKIIAWEHGPVVEEVYREFSGDPYNLSISEKEIEELVKISRKDENLLEEVFAVFGRYSAWGLREKTHEETPWIEATGNGSWLNEEISRETMKRYFLENYVE